MLQKNRNMLSDEAAASQLIHVHAFISSCNDYCNSILYGMYDTILSDLQRIQNTAALILTKCEYNRAVRSNNSFALVVSMIKLKNYGNDLLVM